jgi:ribonuclease P protein component
VTGVTTLRAATFPKERRIRRRTEFTAVFEGAQRVHSRLFTFLLRPNGLDAPRLGIVASRKFGGAVQRNRAKRLIREMFREQVRTLDGRLPVDVVVIPKRDLIETESRAAIQDFQNTWRRAINRLPGSVRG